MEVDGPALTTLETPSIFVSSDGQGHGHGDCFQENHRFAGVSWVFVRFTKAWKNESDETRRARIMEAIDLFKVFSSGGASTNVQCIEWAKQVGFPLLPDLGTT